MPSNTIWQGDSLEIISKWNPAKFNLIYIDPPFNTGTTQRRSRITVTQSDEGTRIGFGDKPVEVEKVNNDIQYEDSFSDYLSFIHPYMLQAHRLLKPNGSMFFHIDKTEAHYCKILLDTVFGRQSFMNEIIWAYDYGGRSKKKWPEKHDTLFWYAKDPNNYTFNYNAIDRIPYLAPALAGPKKAAKGKVPTDVWWQTIVSGKEKTGYPTQKPMAILERIIKVHSNPSDRILDFFAGSGTTGEACQKHGRQFTMIDKNDDAIATMQRRLPGARIICTAK